MLDNIPPVFLSGGFVSLCVGLAMLRLAPTFRWLLFDHGRGPQRFIMGIRRVLEALRFTLELARLSSSCLFHLDI